MNKKLFLGMFATAALFATSCSQDEMVAPGENGTTTFTVNVEGNTASRAIGDASKMDVLYYEVYAEGVDKPVIDASQNGTFPMEISLELIKGQNYKLLMWAQNSESGYDASNLKDVKVEYANNNECKDAFYINQTIKAGTSQAVELVRATAQINVGADSQDIATATKHGVNITQSAVTITDVYTSFNVEAGDVQGETTTVELAATDVEKDEKLVVNGIEYTYLASTYVLAGQKSLVNLDYTFVPDGKEGQDVEVAVQNVPVQQNYRTNIVGTILSGVTNLSISLDNVWDNNNNLYTPWDGKSLQEVAEVDGVYEIENAEQLAWVAQQVNSNKSTFSDKTVKLVDDIYLANFPWTAIGNVVSYPSYTFAGTFDGQGYTIYDLNVTDLLPNHAAAGLFGSTTGTIQNVKVENATVVSSHYAGVICAYSSQSMKISDCHVTNATVTSTPELLSGGSYDNGDKAGAIIGYMAAGGVVNDCSVEKTTITAYRDLGGIVGYSMGTVENCQVLEGVTVTVDATHNYKNYKKSEEYDANSIVGQNDGGTITNCSGEAKLVVPEDVVSVGTAEDLKLMLNTFGAAGAGSNVINITSDIVIDSNVGWEPVKVDGYNGSDVIIINGNGHTIKGLDKPLFAGGFAGGSGIVVNDLTIAESTIVSTNTLGSGAFIETIDSMDEISLNNCHLINSSVTGSRTGGLIGWNSGYDNTNDGAVKTYVTIKGCSVKNCQITGNGTVGGIVGHAGANAWTWNTIENCTVEGCTLTSYDDSYRVGVIVGTANVGEVTISNCVNKNNTCKQDNNGVEIARPKGQSELYGRFVPQNGSGKLTIDGVEIK